jgi:hypothetical protein
MGSRLARSVHIVVQTQKPHSFSGCIWWMFSIGEMSMDVLSKIVHALVLMKIFPRVTLDVVKDFLASSNRMRRWRGHGGQKRILNVHIYISYPFTYL